VLRKKEGKKGITKEKVKYKPKSQGVRITGGAMVMGKLNQEREKKARRAILEKASLTRMVKRLPGINTNSKGGGGGGGGGWGPVGCSQAPCTGNQTARQSK